MDRARVAAVFAAGSSGCRVGSGYAVADRVVLTTAHVLTEAGLVVGGPAQVSLLGCREWSPAAVAWLDAGLDVALVRVDESSPWPAREMSVLRWGRLAGNEPVTAAAIGFPWAQERPDSVRDTEHVVGFVPPGAGVESGQLHLTVLSAAPQPRPGAASPWAGISGAALVAGPHLVGVVVVDPARYGTDRLVAVPVARMLQAAGFCDVLGERPDPVPVGAAWRLEYATDRSLTLAAPYRPLPNFNVTAARNRLLYPEHGVVPFSGRADLVAALAEWCTSGGAGAGGQDGDRWRRGRQDPVGGAGVSGGGREGWDAGFADLDRAGGAVRWQLERPTLLVVDNADLNVGLVADLVRCLAYTDLPVRLLLLARSRSPWWQQLGTATESLVDGFDTGDLPLGAHTLDLPARAAQYQAAFDALARALSGAGRPAGRRARPARPCGGRVRGSADGAPGCAVGRVRGPVQGKTAFRRAGPHRGAAGIPGPGGPAVAQAVHATEGLVEGPMVLRRCVATAAVSSPAATVGASTPEGPAAAMLVAVPDLAEADTGRRRALARWLHWLHQGLDYWNPIRPDPLADQLLADLDVLPELVLSVADQALQVGDRPTVDRLLAELTRAAAASGGFAAAALSMLLRERLSVLFEAAWLSPTGRRRNGS